MPRQRKTDPENAIVSAVSLFWEQGFGNVGTRQIDDVTGITRFTLQTSYGGKMALFLQALDWYLDRFEEFAAPPQSVTSLQDIAAWFEQRTEPKIMPDQAANGCLMLNTIVEFGSTNADVNARADRYFALMRGRFSSALGELVRRGQLAAGFDTSAKSELLVCGAIGLNIAIRAAGSNAAGRDASKACADMIRGWEKGTDR